MSTTTRRWQDGCVCVWMEDVLPGLHCTMGRDVGRPGWLFSGTGAVDLQWTRVDLTAPQPARALTRPAGPGRGIAGTCIHWSPLCCEPRCVSHSKLQRTRCSGLQRPAAACSGLQQPPQRAPALELPVRPIHGSPPFCFSPAQQRYAQASSTHTPHALQSAAALLVDLQPARVSSVALFPSKLPAQPS